MVRYISLLLFIGLAWGQSPCEDPRYLEIKKKSLDEMSQREYAYFIMKEKECNDYKPQKLKSLDNKKWSISLGLGGNRLFSMIGITRDFKITNGFGMFIGGFGIPALAIGAYLQPNYNKNGLNGSLALGPSSSGNNTELSINLNYQWLLGNNGFISLGLSQMVYEEVSPYGYYTCCETGTFTMLYYHFRL